MQPLAQQTIHNVPSFSNKTIVIDYPSPNVAKQMHVGHLRPMVIGEATARILKFIGAKVIADDHIGDWGTHFGTLIVQVKKLNDSLDFEAPDILQQLESLYKQGTQAEKKNPNLRQQAREELVRLQQGDVQNIELWKKIVSVSKKSFQEIYKRLGITTDYTLGESFYKDKLNRIYDELIETGIAQESEGALVVFHKEHPRFKDQPLIIRKQDGSSNYASTDLATVLYRVEHFKADVLVYLTDVRQKDHFEQLFLTVEKWFKIKRYPLPKFFHLTFGTILGNDGKAIRTREGTPLFLNALLNEAVLRATQIIEAKSSDLSENQKFLSLLLLGLEL